MQATMRKLHVKTALLAVVLALVGSSVQAQQDTDWMKDVTSRITFNGYAQAGYSWQNTNNVNRNDFNLKRTLLWAKARITDRWSFLFMHDFSSVVQEYYTDYRFSNDKALTVRLGQFKHSYSMENPLSPTQLELVDVYSQAVLYLAGEGPDPLNGVNYGRDMGLMVFGDLFNNHLHYELAVMNGQGVNRRDGNKHKGKGHAVGEAAWNPGVKVGDDYTRDRYSIGAEVKTGAYAPGKYKEARPVSVRAEWLGGKDGDVGSRGGYITTCVPLIEGIDLVASADYYDRNTSLDYDQTQATMGLQYWFYKKCRVQLQYTYTWSQFQTDYSWLQAQVQFAF